jgi:3-dehydroquinate dehydratase-2
MKKILIINGPNLNLLGHRQPGIYGNKSFEEYLSGLKKQFPELTLDYFQSNHEGMIIDKIHEAGKKYDGLVINAGGYSHTSVAIADGIASISIPSIEVHISNIYAREEYRRHSYMSPFCKAVISGCGLAGYEFAIRALVY